MTGVRQDVLFLYEWSNSLIRFPVSIVYYFCNSLTFIEGKDKSIILYYSLQIKDTINTMPYHLTPNERHPY